MSCCSCHACRARRAGSACSAVVWREPEPDRDDQAVGHATRRGFRPAPRRPRFLLNDVFLGRQLTAPGRAWAAPLPTPGFVIVRGADGLRITFPPAWSRARIQSTLAALGHCPGPVGYTRVGNTFVPVCLRPGAVATTF